MTPPAARSEPTPSAEQQTRSRSGGYRTRSNSAELRARASELLVTMHSLPDDDPKRQRIRDELVEMHIPLVEYLARRFAGRNEPMPDLVQVGVIGLIKSIDRFEPERGLEFSTYATPTILGEIKRHFRDAGWLVRVPRRLQELQTTISTARAELSQELGRAPTVHELAQRIDISDDEALDGLESARAYAGFPLEALTEEGTGRTDHPKLGMVDHELERVEQREMLRPAIETLPEREREILLLRFVANKTQTEIAGIIGISQMQVSRLVARGLARLREQLSPETPEQ